MSSQNMFESAVDEILAWVERISDEVAPLVMGGKEPPFMRKMSGVRLAEWWGELPAGQKLERWLKLTSEERSEIQKAMRGDTAAGGVT